MKAVPLCRWKFFLVITATLASASSWGQLDERVLHSFAGGTDGEEPYAGLVQGADGALYGTTFLGGTNGAGLLFKVNPDGSGNAPILSFERNSIDPGGIANPSGLIQGADGVLYGTEGFGGTNEVGSVFRVNPDGTGFAVLYSFSHLMSGPYEPTAALVQGRDGMLYGTTQLGGLGTLGAVFKVSTNGTGYTTLHHFFGGSTDGNQPQSPLIQGMDGALYGATTLGGASSLGGASGFGTLYKLNTDGTGFTILHNFMPSGGDGQYPFTAGLVQGNDGVIYGTTQQGGSTAEGGGSGQGTVFKINSDGSGYAIIHNFTGGTDDGALPNSALVFGRDRILYGTTEFGGISNNGVAFRLNTQGAAYQVLHHFGVITNDGRYPGAPLIQANDGGLFGTTKFGGDSNKGTVFRLAPGPPTIAALPAQADKAMRLTVVSASNFTYRIEVSSNHLDWCLLTNVENTTGSVLVIDYGASKSPMRFYRAAWVP